MSSYKYTVKSAIKCYPSLFLYEADVIDHLFFVNGNGYGWHKGQLVGYQNHKESFVEAISHRKPDETFDSIRENEIKYRKSTSKLFGEQSSAYYDPSGKFAKEIYPICKYACIMNIPDDIRNDWLQAAKLACDLARSSFVKMTKSDERFLDIAEKRINELALKNSARFTRSIDEVLEVFPEPQMK